MAASFYPVDKICILPKYHIHECTGEWMVGQISWLTLLNRANNDITFSIKYDLLPSVVIQHPVSSLTNAFCWAIGGYNTVRDASQSNSCSMISLEIVFYFRSLGIKYTAGFFSDSKLALPFWKEVNGICLFYWLVRHFICKQSLKARESGALPEQLHVDIQAARNSIEIYAPCNVKDLTKSILGSFMGTGFFVRNPVGLPLYRRLCSVASIVLK